ncbi:hypothetical protein [Mariniflexile sp. AS56]|uniref:hypothetical protein n=1 Tax=Mariniflexile sp. AS56 TaxID=3063957 RepID=UPI0026F2229F|nr:hypothetical protein [Mariniflexile sp. AS56]MDO7173452.1 hypothetical protein [Mariniflexile sp. AS56]
MEFYNKIGLGNYYNKSIYEKVDLLLESGAFKTHLVGFDIADYFKEDFEDDYLINKHDDEIAKLPGLYVNPDVLKEIHGVVLKGIIDDPYPQTYIGIELIDDYQFGLMAVTDNESKKEVIKGYLKETVKLFSKFCGSDTSLGLVFTMGFNKEEFFKYVYDYYNTQNTLRQPNSYFVLKMDVIAHLCPPSDKADIKSYLSAVDFMVIKDYYCHIEFLKEELLKCNQFQKTRLTPLQQVCYIHKLKEKPQVFFSLDIQEKLRHLNNMTGGKNPNKELQLKTLEWLIELDSFKHDELLENISEYARKLNEICENDLSNLRKAIRSLYCTTPIKSKNIKSNKDILHNEKYNNEQKKLRLAFDKIYDFF